MSEEVISDPEALELLQSLAQDSCELAGLIDDLRTSFDGLFPPPHCAQQFAGLKEKYTTVVSRLDAAIRQCQKGIAVFEGEPASPWMSAISSAATSGLPSRSPSIAYFHIQTPHVRVLDTFLRQELPRVGLPYPPLCGAIPAPNDYILPVSSFVAARVEEQWTLCYVIGINENSYELCDADPNEDAPTFTVSHETVIPLPTSLPDRRTKYAEYAANTEVLALWLEGSEWTSVFYKARVVKPPSETGDVYRLKFIEDTGDRAKTVPPNFVIPFPRD